MKQLILVLFLLVSIGHADAKSWLIVNKETKEILSLSPEDDAQLPNDSFEKIILEDDFENIELSAHPTYYKYKNNKFVLNVKKISDEELENEEAAERQVEEAMIQERIRKIAIDELKAEGKVFKYIDK